VTTPLDEVISLREEILSELSSDEVVAVLIDSIGEVLTSHTGFDAFVRL